MVAPVDRAPRVYIKDDSIYQLDSSFVHPGGQKVLDQYSGQDISAVFKGAHGGHCHSRAAEKLLESYRIKEAETATAQSQADSKAPASIVDQAADVLDFSRPLLFQVGALGDQYDEWVHAPVAGKPRFFASNAMENISTTPWWVVPLCWIPVLLLLGTYILGFQQGLSRAVLGRAAAGVLLWQLIEYCVHRFLFHAEPTSYWGITLHFTFHGCHHKYPMDKGRLVFPPVPGLVVGTVAVAALSLLVPQAVLLPLAWGTILGYVAYDCLHYAIHHGIHHGNVTSELFAPLRNAHLGHHFVDWHNTYGISSPVYDILFRTQRPSAKPASQQLHNKVL
ncbi:hypothetical protein WJX72_012279 [[Myrmecia] bisecta]|uniref:Fatty acid 2-hydroxylase n=1 Tax=[Myrmecia] bisecta TaxID=41462 RepID=A0AAW1PD71_9CHLO